MAFKEHTVEKWCGWISSIRENVADLYFNRAVFQRLLQLGQDHPTRATVTGELITISANAFWHYLHRTYIDYAAAAVRRQSRKHKDSISLLGLLHDVAGHTSLITRADFLLAEALPYADGRDPRKEPNGFFDRFATPDAATIDAAFVRDDIGALEVAARDITMYADRAVAHLDKRGSEALADLEAIDDPVEVIGRLLQKYGRLIAHQGDDLHRPPVVVIEANLRTLFSQPWTTPPD
jgi:hypothetical protein